VYRRDYILRLIERFGRILLTLRDRILRRAVAAEDLRAEIHEIAREAGLDLDLARQLDPAMLLMWLSPTGEVDEPKFWLLAELLYLEGLDVREAGAVEEARAHLARARAVFGRLPAGWRPSEGLASAGARCDEIDRTLQDL